MAPPSVAARAAIRDGRAIPGIGRAKARPTGAANFRQAHFEAAQAAILAYTLAARIERTPRSFVSQALINGDKVRGRKSQRQQSALYGIPHHQPPLWAVTRRLGCPQIYSRFELHKHSAYCMVAARGESRSRD